MNAATNSPVPRITLKMLADSFLYYQILCSVGVEIQFTVNTKPNILWLVKPQRQNISLKAKCRGMRALHELRYQYQFHWLVFEFTNWLHV